jgi:hypothetical protein
MTSSAVIVVACLIIALCLLVKPVTGQDEVTATESADYKELAKSILRPDVTGVTINSVVFTGDARQIGTYAATGTIFDGLPRSGVVMSSGKVTDVKTAGIPDTNLNRPGDVDLSKVLQNIGLTGIARDTYDAAVLVVDLAVEKAVDIDIAYVFGSAEYFWPSPTRQYADVFGLFHGDLNVALIGQNNDPVSVQNLNCKTTPQRNCNQLTENPSPYVGTSLDGYTKKQIATLKLLVGTNQKVKIAIADARSKGDDAAVFLSFQGFRPTLAPTRSPTLKPTMSPTMEPSQKPTLKPSQSPTLKPTMKPTRTPTRNPTLSPTRKPVMKLTQQPVLPPMPLMAPSPPPVKGKMKMMGMMGEMM